MQAKILTAIEDHAIRRVGASRAQSVDARVIAATSLDLRRLVADGKFREDLFHRLDLFRVRLPPLRERGDDVIELAQRLVARTCKRYGLPPREIPPAGRARLLAHRWPGNVRELAHEVERAVVFERGDGGEDTGLRFDALALRTHDSAASGGAGAGWLNENFVFPESGFALEEAINTLVERALAQAGGNVSAAARLLGVTRDFVRYRMKDRPSAGS
jgi:DNA-binding NtrC family response regulator